MVSYIHYCKTCGLRDPQANTCQLTGFQVNPYEDFCSKHQGNLEVCEICGQPILKPIIDVSTNGEFHIICQSCAKERMSCTFCSKNGLCSFENDPSPLPKVVMQTINKGNMVMQTQVPNPDRIRETCQKNCFCFDAEIGCLRQNNYCGSLDFTWEVGQHE